MSRIQELSLEQLHYDISELTSAVNQYMAKAYPEYPRHLNVTVQNPTKEFDGNVVVQNEVKAEISNLSGILEQLDSLKKSVEGLKLDKVTVDNEIVVKDLEKLSDLLQKLLKKETTVNVAAPRVKVDVPDEVKVQNWPTNPKVPIAVRLSDGQRFIEQLTKVVSSGGGGYSYKDGAGAAAFPVLNEGSVPVLTNNGMVPPLYDYVGMTYPNSATDVFTFRLGGSDGTVQGVLTITYTDSTKERMSSAARTS